eukprot:CAMPEP_0206569608 /NCGR_PEP_ID=MMETSP0325_2-20121206/26537_1 /ASSEMBLY_ACC=CAM_ASM_000347 /TAXON_ID=2866 /ORGANISM="Crypthecodinium cohnii, Strain Seligo" /LENGTH=137 /DNA_ID=CAMNT_0054073225 /DNA_START=1 /DNA_END=414 /DNA_ORIENTATION=-
MRSQHNVFRQARERRAAVYCAGAAAEEADGRRQTVVVVCPTLPDLSSLPASRRTMGASSVSALVSALDKTAFTCVCSRSCLFSMTRSHRLATRGGNGKRHELEGGGISVSVSVSMQIHLLGKPAWPGLVWPGDVARP